jgi:hypothetical protein
MSTAETTQTPISTPQTATGPWVNETIADVEAGRVAARIVFQP